MNRQPITRTSLVLLGVVALAAVAAVAGFRAVLVDWTFMPAAVLGGVGGAGLVAIAWWRRLLVGESIALSLVGLVVAGSVAAQGIPSPSAFVALFDGLRSGWAVLLSTTPPLDVDADMRVLTFTLAWVGSVIGGELFRRTRTPALPIAGPLIALTVSVLVTGEDRTVALGQGVTLAVAALVVGLVQFNRSDSAASNMVGADVRPDDAKPKRQQSTSFMVRAGATLALVAIAAPWVGPRLPNADAHERFDLRSRNDPPWDPLSVKSPLVGFKAFLRDSRLDDVMFVVESDERITRFATATLGDYDGVVWTVGSTDDADVVEEFRSVGRSLPNPIDPTDATATTATGTFTIETLRGPFVPIPGRATEIDFTDESASSGGGRRPDDDLRMNLLTGTLALPGGLHQGLTYDFVSTAPDPRSDETLRLLDVADLPPKEDDDITPPQVRNLAADLVEGVDDGWEQVEAIRDAFLEDGFYDTSRTARPGHALSRIATFLDDPERIVGYEEQYAATAAILARTSGIPARVVVGFTIPESRYEDGRAEVRSADATAWIEIDLGTDGWEAVDVTPDRSREPQADDIGKTIEDVAIPSPPPPPQTPPNLDLLSTSDDVKEEDEEDDEDEDEEATDTSGIAVPVALAIGVGSAVALFALVLLLIASWKARRRKHRRAQSDPARSVAGAWHEVVDRHAEVGERLPSDATPAESARAFCAAASMTYAISDDESDDLILLSRIVERSAYHHEPPNVPDADAAWTYHDRVVNALLRRQTRLKRLRMRVDPATVRSTWPSNDSSTSHGESPTDETSSSSTHRTEMVS